MKTITYEKAVELLNAEIDRMDGIWQSDVLRNAVRDDTFDFGRFDAEEVRVCAMACMESLAKFTANLRHKIGRHAMRNIQEEFVNALTMDVFFPDYTDETFLYTYRLFLGMFEDHGIVKDEAV